MMTTAAAAPRHPIYHAHASPEQVCSCYRAMLALLGDRSEQLEIDDLLLLNEAAGVIVKPYAQVVDYYGDGSSYVERRDCIRDAAMIHLSHHEQDLGGRRQGPTVPRDWLLGLLRTALSDLDPLHGSDPTA